MTAGVMSALASAAGGRSVAGFPRTETAVWRCAANLLIKQHGDEAAIHAAMRADKMLDAGDLDGAAMWRRIIRAIEELQRKEPRQDEAVN